MLEIEQILNQTKTAEAEYNQYISAGDRMLEAKDYEKAQEKYNLALAIRPDEKYPKEKLKQIDTEIQSQLAAVQEAYDKAIAEANAFFEAKDYDKAKIKYQAALKVKPDEPYPQQKIGEIEQLVSSTELLQVNYSKLIADADALFRAKDYQEAKAKYVEAAALFPKEEYPAKKIEEINLHFKSGNLKQQQDYDKAIADADKFFASGIFDQALESYRLAKSYAPDESYPDEMIGRILGILDANAIRDLIGSPVSIGKNEEKRLTFEPVPVADRKTSFIFIKASNAAETECRVVLSYGKGSTKNGGFIIPIPAQKQNKEYIIPIGKQYTWFSQNNDWISLVPQGGSVEINLIKISKGQ